MRLLVFIPATLILAACTKTTQLPMPMFELVGGVPGFVVECRNTGSAAVDPAWEPKQMRLDGQDLPLNGNASFVGGVPKPVKPGETWDAGVVLHPPATKAIGDDPKDALVTSHVSVALTPGQHVVSFECAGNWTEPITFVWQQP